MAAIADACERGSVHARIVAVIADQPQAGGLALARERGLATQCIPAADFSGRAPFDAALLAALQKSGAEIIALAGFMRILGASLVESLSGRLLNIHPSLLPLYPGLHTHRRALSDGATLHGATVHYVTAKLDGGPRVLQGSIAVRPGETEQALSARVQTLEHIIYPRVLEWIASGRLRCIDGQPQLDQRALTHPVQENFDV